MAALLAMSGTAPLTADAAPAPVYDCPNSIVSVDAPETADLNEICAGADDAVAFFVARGLPPGGPLVVEVVPRLPEAVGSTAVGCFLEEEQRTLLLAYAAFARNTTWFGVPADRALYRSLVTHEVAHALAARHFSIRRPTIQAKEYLAYVAMFATMDPALRGPILTANPGKGFRSELAINTAVYLCDPMRFGIRAYRHYLEEGNGDAFLNRVLSGRALNGH